MNTKEITYYPLSHREINNMNNNYICIGIFCEKC